ncbi:MAG: YbaB/EbfC family nucleoid-associated protein [Phycisphaerales bacterium]|jgi:nucleoid-associated protein EbfC|nr:YbaB/EbfC family nucleoid-associated protein [Phycisphaerales bacterium]
MMFGNIGKMMQMVGELKTRLPEMQQKLDESRFTASAGGGVVSATVTGKLRIVGVQLDKELLGDVETEVLEDLIAAAVSAAQEQAADAAKEAMKELTGGAEIPGLGGLLG